MNGATLGGDGGSRTPIARRFEESPRERVKHKGTVQAVTTAELECSERRRHTVAARLPGCMCIDSKTTEQHKVFISHELNIKFRSFRHTYARYQKSVRIQLRGDKDGSIDLYRR